MGRRWTTVGVVQHGDARGRTIGFPTANLHLGDNEPLAFGIYAVRVDVLDAAGKVTLRRDGVANFGIRPMFRTKALLLEVHLFDFVGDLYDRQLRVEFIDWLRPEAFFPTLEALVSQIRLRDAVLYAFCSGRPLNEFVTAHFEKAVVKSFARFRSRLLKIMGNWLSRRCGFPACYVWVLENAPPDEDGFGGGLHMYLMVHLPTELRKEFRQAWESRWIERAGGVIRKNAVRCKAVEHTNPAADLELYLRHGLWGALRYHLKGVDPAVAPEFDIEPSDQGAVAGKRLGYSSSAPQTSRAQARALNAIVKSQTFFF